MSFQEKNFLLVALFALLYCCLVPAGVARCAATSAPGDTTPVSSLENPYEAAATTGDLEGSAAASGELDSDDICLRCYDKVKMAQDMIAIQTSLLEKQKKLIHRKSKAAAEAARTAASAGSAQLQANGEDTFAAITNGGAGSATRRLSRKFINNNENSNLNNDQAGSTVRSRTLQTSEPIVISRLRVARAAAPAIGGVQTNTNSNNHKLGGLNKKDPDLKRLKQEQHQQLNATCKSLLLVQECLSELSRECIGNLQFHSLEVYSNQWHSKLSCPYRNNPSLRVFPGLRSIQEEIEPPKSPVPRRISSDEEVRSRLHEMFPNGFARPFGVMLKPTLTTSASQRFGQLLQAQQQQQHQQEGNRQQQLRDFSGHNFNHQLQISQQNSYEQVVDDFHVGRILLVPCCFAIMVAVVALASLYHWRPIDEKV